jgi:hypothetical protein
MNERKNVYRELTRVEEEQASRIAELEAERNVDLFIRCRNAEAENKRLRQALRDYAECRCTATYTCPPCALLAASEAVQRGSEEYFRLRDVQR